MNQYRGGNWSQRCLGDLVQNFDRQRIPLSRRERERRQGPFPYFGATGVMDYVDDFLFDGLYLLVAEDGSVETPDGKPFLQLADGQFWVNNHAHVLRGSTHQETQFLYYALSTIDVRPYVSGSVQAKLSQGNLNRILIPYPINELDRQAITHILGALDEKIEMNRRINETLEATARALFQDWFVDFGPTRAKAGGCPPYLPPTMWDLFPDTLDDEAKPVGWTNLTVADIAAQHKATVSPTEMPDTTFEHYSIPAYDNGQVPAFQLGSEIKSNKTELPEEAVLLSKLNPEIPRVWLPDPKTDAPQICSTEFLVYVPNPGFNRSLLYAVFTASGFRQILQNMVTGTSKSHQRVPPNSVLEMTALCGEARIIQAFADTMRWLFNQLLANRSESVTLTQTRDLLLPKLVSGELRIKAVEQLLKETA